MLAFTSKEHQGQVLQSYIHPPYTHTYIHSKHHCCPMKIIPNLNLIDLNLYQAVSAGLFTGRTQGTSATAIEVKLLPWKKHTTT